MELFLRADDALRKIHQALVDWSEHHPRWWIRHCAYPLVITALVKWSDLDSVWRHLGFLIDLFWVVSFLTASRVDWVLAELRDWSANWRQLYLATMAICIAAAMLKAALGLPISARWFVWVDSFLFGAGLYFAVCFPPPPPTRRMNARLAFSR